jgi:hypothetical protein
MMLRPVPAAGRMTIKLPLPYRRPRALAQGNDLLGIPGVALDVVGIDVGDALEAGWQRRVHDVSRAVGWPSPAFARRDDEQARTLAFTAPANQLQTACAVNAWALCAALVELDPCHWGSLRDVASDDQASIDRLVRLGVAEDLATG